MLTKINYKTLLLSILILSGLTIIVYLLFSAPKNIHNIFKMITDYLSIGVLSVGYLWACFNEKIKSRLLTQVTIGGLFIAFITVKLGYDSPIAFNVLTSLSVLLIYLLNNDSNA